MEIKQNGLIIISCCLGINRVYEVVVSTLVIERRAVLNVISSGIPGASGMLVSGVLPSKAQVMFADISLKTCGVRTMQDCVEGGLSSLECH